jgi:hypothetical protein
MGAGILIARLYDALAADRKRWAAAVAQADTPYASVKASWAYASEA